MYSLVILYVILRRVGRAGGGGGEGVAFLLTDTYTRLDLKLEACGVV